MDKDIIKMVILQEKVNEFFINLDGKKNILEEMKRLGILDSEFIDILFSEYYVKNKNSMNKSVKGLVNFIEDYAVNKDLLHNCFMNNVGMSNELINNYYQDFISNYNINRDYDKLNIEDKKTALQLSPIFKYRGFSYLQTLARYTLYKAGCDNLPEMSGCSIKTDKEPINDINVLMRVLIGDAYTYMVMNNDNLEFNDYIKIIDDNASDFNKLLAVLLKNPDILRNFLIYFCFTFTQKSYYDDLYVSLENKNSKHLDTLKKINPFYILDRIEEFNIKKYVKKRR